MNTDRSIQCATLFLCFASLVPRVCEAVQGPRCSDPEPTVAIESAKAGRDEHRQAFAFLRNWPEGTVLSQGEEETRSRAEDSIVVGLRRSFGNDLERVLLSLMSDPQATRDPRMAQSAAGAYILARLPEARIRNMLQSSTSNSQRVILFDALASVEGPGHRVSAARTTAVCWVASESLRTGTNEGWIRDVLDHFLFVLRDEAQKGSEPARALLSDSVVETAATVLKRN